MGNHRHFVAWPGEEQSRWELSLSRSRPFGDDGWMDQTVKKLELEQTVRGQGGDQIRERKCKVRKTTSFAPFGFPYGEDRWVGRLVSELGLQYTIRDPWRPAKAEDK